MDGGSSPTTLYDEALGSYAEGGEHDLAAESEHGSRTLPLARWCGAADAVDVAALDRLRSRLGADPAVLDLGCGPGRHAAHLHKAGAVVLGVDCSRRAVLLTRARGVRAVQADALGPLPAGPAPCGGWDAVLLLDGNVGIGGDPLLLLCRVRDLLVPGGLVLAELDRDGTTARASIRLRRGARRSLAFPWAWLAAAELDRQARWADLTVVDRWSGGGRSFAVLTTGAGS